MCNKNNLVFLILLCVFSTPSLYAQATEEQGTSASPTIVISDFERSATLAQTCFDQLVDGAQANLLCSYRIASFLLFQMPDLQDPEKKEENLQIIDALRESNIQQKQALEFVRENATDAKRSEEVAKLLVIADNLVIFSEQFYFGLDNPGEEGAEAIGNGIERFEQVGEELFADEIK